VLAALTFNICNHTFRDPVGTALIISKDSVGFGSFAGTISSNNLESSGRTTDGSLPEVTPITSMDDRLLIDGSV